MPKASFGKICYKKSRFALGRYGHYYRNFGVSSRLFMVAKGTACYWCQKYEDPKFHSNVHGGSRRAAFSEMEFLEINQILWEQCHQKPTSRLLEYELEIEY
jgi:hypothetical protein